MDTDGDGEIGFDEFTLLNEEKWRNMDPYAHYQKGIDGREAFVKSSSTRMDEANNVRDLG
jgi:hypothetical protein